MIRLIKKINNKKGQALLEMALVLPIILLLIFGIIEFGRIYNAYLIINNASREGARHAAVGGSYDEIRSEINEITSTLGTVEITFTPSNENEREQGEDVVVMVRHSISLITPIIGPLISNSNTFDIDSSTTMRME